MKTTTIAVIGSRSFGDAALLASVLDSVAAFGLSRGFELRFVSGGADGADKLAEAWCRERDLPITVIRPDYKMHGRSAPLIRNGDIVRGADGVIAFWDGVSKGTLHALEIAKRFKKLILVVPAPGALGAREIRKRWEEKNAS
jgi:hypothetical protein